MISAAAIASSPEFTVLERIPTTVCTGDVEGARRAADLIAGVIRDHQNQSKPAVLGLATGSTPVGVYRELIRRHRDEGLDFSSVTTFNLDEYYPMSPDSIHSYYRWMRENFFDHVNVPTKNIHIPDGTLPRERVADYCREYDAAIAAAGGIDVQVLGIGRTGHIGFNEPGSSRDSRTRLISLDPTTRRDAAADFFGEENVPRQAITMGVGTILEARQILLLAFGEQKAPIIQRAVEGPVTDAVAASFLQAHPRAEVIVGPGAGAGLARLAKPWVLREIEWAPENAYRAVIWLSLEVGKSVLKLDHDDYDTHSLASLVRHAGSADALNRRVFDRLTQTIAVAEPPSEPRTEWHGHLARDSRPGRPCHEVPGGPVHLPEGKPMLCFSPHPDDDVISMGATMKRLVEYGNDLHVAYMTSGNIAVSDDFVSQMIEFWSDLNHAFQCDSAKSADLEERVRAFLASKAPGDVDSPEVQEIKGQIRRSEALAACRWMDIPPAHAHFLNLPFYQTGQVRKRPIGHDDVRIVLELIREVRPRWVFMAGEMADPHGTHRLCAEAIFAALRECRPEERPDAVWLYRGAWQEWDPHVIDMAIPFSRSELTHKIFGIFKHQSQKDKALFPGPYDDREFWQRAEARNTESASLYNRLGLPEHYAMEAFVRYEAS